MASTDSSQPTCQNCATSTTPLWRRDEIGSVLCNACGLFLKLHGRARPISLKTDVIKSRNRVKTSGQGQGQKKKVGPALLLCLSNSLTCCHRAFSTITASETRDLKQALHLPDPSVIVVLRKSHRMAILMAQIPRFHVLQHPRCMEIMATTSNPTTATASQSISFTIPLRSHHFIYVNHPLVDLNPQ
jgi:hypothetical protein